MALELARDGADLAAVVGFHSGLATAAPAAAGAVTARVLVCIGVDDPLIPAEQRIAFEAGDERRRRRLADEPVLERGAQLHQPGGGRDRHARRASTTSSPTSRSWRAMLDLFEEVF